MQTIEQFAITEY